MSSPVIFWPTTPSSDDVIYEQPLWVVHKFWGSLQMITVIHRGGLAEWLQYYVGVGPQMVTVLHRGGLAIDIERYISDKAWILVTSKLYILTGWSPEFFYLWHNSKRIPTKKRRGIKFSTLSQAKLGITLLLCISLPELQAISDINLHDGSLYI